MKTKVFIATQQEPLFKVRDYLPIILGGKKTPVSYEHIDSTGDNISSKNPYYCELTGYYWIWKNYKCDNVGLVHYRRALISKSTKNVIEADEINRILKDYDVILPKKNYYTKKYRDFYHLPEDLKVIEKIITDKYPDYKETFNYNMGLHSSYICNILITNKQLFDGYCEWLFGVLAEFEKKVKYQDRDNYGRRAPGFAAEFLLGIYIRKNGYRVYELPMKIFDSKNKSYSANNRLMNCGTGFYTFVKNLRQFALKLIFRNH